jgi:hypothetical protein
MQHILVAVFDNRNDARKALEQLVSAGFTRGQARLSEGDPAGDTSAAPNTNASGASRAAGDDGSFISGIRHFFTDIFGTDRHEDARMYSEAVSRGHYVLTLTADTVHEVERAADLVERFGPIDIDEHAQQWPGAGAGARQESAPMSQQLAQGAPASAPQRSQQGSQQRGATAIPGPDELAAGKRQAERGGVRIYQREVETPVDDSAGLDETAVRRTEVEVEQRASEDEAYFRGHWSSYYAGEGGIYDDYAPAYSYGSTMARSELYRGRQWNDVEHNLRSDWQARHPGSAWEKVKAAIRHGWERITS